MELECSRRSTTFTRHSNKLVVSLSNFLVKKITIIVCSCFWKKYTSDNAFKVIEMRENNCIKVIHSLDD